MEQYEHSSPPTVGNIKEDQSSQRLIRDLQQRIESQDQRIEKLERDIRRLRNTVRVAISTANIINTNTRDNR